MNGIMQTGMWQNLQHHAAQLKHRSISQLFENKQRFKQFSLSHEGLLLDYSKNPLTQESLALLFQLADEKQLKQRIQALFSGAQLNVTQQLPALHTALRDPRPNGLMVNGVDILKLIHAALNKMQHFVETLKLKQPHIKDIVHIGIGGSDLGPMMAIEALKAFQHNNYRFHFISNVNSHLLYHLLQQLKPQSTLVIIASKSFSTQETLLNANILRDWLKASLDTNTLKKHLVAITAHFDKAIHWGIEEENIFPIWDWVGGRFSLCSCISLSLALAIGMDQFRSLLKGAHALDQHFTQQPWSHNLPVLLALIGIWQRNFFNTQAHAILPYEPALRYLPPYLQQLEMESNGKSIQLNNQPVDYATCPIIFGDIGLNGQHAYYQLFHQGTERFSADFIVSLKPTQKELPHFQQHIIANALSQSKTFMEGNLHEVPYKQLTGNHANNTIALNELTPFTLGLLIALYEHKVFVQSVIWNINPFDQWGVEYGKKLSHSIQNALQQSDHTNPFDSSTEGMIKRFHEVNKEPNA